MTPTRRNVRHALPRSSTGFSTRSVEKWRSNRFLRGSIEASRHGSSNRLPLARTTCFVSAVLAPVAVLLLTRGLSTPGPLFAQRFTSIRPVRGERRPGVPASKPRDVRPSFWDPCGSGQGDDHARLHQVLSWQRTGSSGSWKNGFLSLSTRCAYHQNALVMTPGLALHQ